MPFTDADLLNHFQQSILDSLPFLNKKHFVLGYSGGMDSQVLLSLSASLAKLVPEFRFRVVHINHGLQKHAAEWEDFCQKEAAKHGARITVDHLYLDSENVSEALARTARYCAFGKALTEHEVLLTAHHARDQAETLMLRLFRRSGVSGLAAMRPLAAHHGLTIFRPLLKAPYAQLQAYAENKNLSWVEDPTNAQTKYDRNYVRHAVLPVLEKRWPAVVESMNEVAEYCQEAEQLLLELGRVDYPALLSSNGGLSSNDGLSSYGGLSISALFSLTEGRAKNAFMAWLKDRTHEFVYPSVWRRVTEVIANSSREKQPIIQFKSIFFRIYQDHIYCFNSDQESLNARFITYNHALENRKWSFQCVASQVFEELNLSSVCEPAALGDSNAHVLLNKGWLKQHARQLYWRLPKKRDRFQPQAKPYAMQFKKLWQEHQVLPWHRYRHPVLEGVFNGKPEILYAPGVGVHPKVASEASGEGCNIRFRCLLSD